MSAAEASLPLPATPAPPQPHTTCQRGVSTRGESREEPVPATSKEGLQPSPTPPASFHTEQGSLGASRGVSIGTRTGSSAFVCPSVCRAQGLAFASWPLSPPLAMNRAGKGIGAQPGPVPDKLFARVALSSGGWRPSEKLGQGQRHISCQLTHGCVLKRVLVPAPGKCLHLSLPRTHPFSCQEKFWGFRRRHLDPNFDLLLKPVPLPDTPVDLRISLSRAFPAFSPALCLSGPRSIFRSFAHTRCSQDWRGNTTWCGCHGGQSKVPSPGKWTPSSTKPTSPISVGRAWGEAGGAVPGTGKVQVLSSLPPTAPQ